jgi:rhodanese-related sulfurtransferase
MLRRSIPLLLLGAALLVGGAACRKHNPAVGEVTVAAAAAALQQDAVFVDVNTPDFRAANGKVPGALLLASHREYSPQKELAVVKDKHLIFYCTSRL